MRAFLSPTFSMRATAALHLVAPASLAAASLSLATANPARAQASTTQQAETFTGTVKGDSGVAIPNAQITVTPAGAGFSAAVTARSNLEGRWTATVSGRSAEYFVTVSAIGWI